MYFRIQKIEHHIMAELGRLALTYMEKKSILSNAMVDDFLDEVDFKVLIKYKCTIIFI